MPILAIWALRVCEFTTNRFTSPFSIRFSISSRSFGETSSCSSIACEKEAGVRFSRFSSSNEGKALP
jgi:hypothetical protein